jgi:hypothetical protein
MEVIFRCGVLLYHNHANIAYLNKAPTDLEETKRKTIAG